jgi:hypothetical protein
VWAGLRRRRRGFGRRGGGVVGGGAAARRRSGRRRRAADGADAVDGGGAWAATGRDREEKSARVEMNRAPVPAGLKNLTSDGYAASRRT